MFKRLFFPLLALAVPIGVVGWMFMREENKVLEEFRVKEREANQMGIQTKLPANLPPPPIDSQNGVKALAAGYDAITWDPPITKWVSAGTTTAEMPKVLAVVDGIRTAAKRPAFWVAPTVYGSSTSERIKVLLSLRLGSTYARLLATQGKYDEAVAFLKDIDLLNQRFGDTAFGYAVIDSRVGQRLISQSALAIAAESNGAETKNVRDLIRPLTKIDVKRLANNDCPQALAAIDEFVKNPPKEFEPEVRSALSNKETVIHVKENVLRAYMAIYRIPGGQASPQKISDTINQNLDYSYLNGQVVSILLRNIPDSILALQGISQPGDLPQDLIPAFLEICGNGGRAPKEHVRDASRQSIKMIKLKDGFVVYTVGPNGVDEKGKAPSDDRRIQIASGLVTSHG